MVDEVATCSIQRALTSYDVLFNVFEHLGHLRCECGTWNSRDLRACSLVCVAWAESARSAMWSELPSLCPLWHLLAPSTLPFPHQGLSNRYIDTVSNSTS